MNTVTLEMTDMANGGAALGRDEAERVVFVPLAIPGERVQVEIVEDKKRFARARLLSVERPSPDRVTPRCPHFGPCGGCHFQHIDYPAQLRYKEAVVRDQLGRIGGLADVAVRPVMASPMPWHFASEVTFHLTPEGELGFWSPMLGGIMKIETCLLLRQELLALFEDLDLALPELRRLTLRAGSAGELMAVFETQDLEPPALEVDFPVSAALLLPDATAANLIGENYLVQTIKGRDFRVSAGAFCYPNLAAAEILIETVLDYASLGGSEKVLELHSGSALLTAFLAAEATELIGVEWRADAVADAVVNLHSHENIALYEGPLEEIVPRLDFMPNVIVAEPAAEGLSPEVIDALGGMTAKRLVYVSQDVATLARDCKRLTGQGYRLAEVQPIDMVPQTFQVYCVALFHHRA